MLLRNTRLLVLSALLPLLLLIVIHGGKAESRLGGSLFIIAVSLTVGLLSTSIIGYVMTVARDREKGVFQRLKVTPAPTWAIMLSRLLVQIVLNLIVAVVVLIVGSGLHNLSLGAGEYAAALLTSILGAAVFLSIGQALVGLLKSAGTIIATGTIVYMVLIYLGILGVSGLLGATLQTISIWTPVGTVMTVFETVIKETAWNGHAAMALLTCFLYTALFGFVGIKWFRWEAR